jgi:acetyl-CoA carboxylase carboxyl transferase beta subunit
LRAGFEFNIIQISMDTTSFIKKSLGTETIEPALTPPPVDAPQATFAKKPKLGAGKAKSKKRDIPEGLWTKCPACSAMIFDKELDENLKVCPKCNHHFPIGSRERVHSLVETCTFEEMDASMTSVDMLRFKGVATYKSKLEEYQKSTTLKDAVVTGLCKIGSHRVALGVMDFSFLGGSMGSVVGEKLTRLIERATEKELPVIIISTSGGARMYEGMFSLMQMAKTAAALPTTRNNACPTSACSRIRQRRASWPATRASAI